ncbi:MAG: outer membrane beta-barrel protein [Bacteroidales bacterium]
MMKKTLLFVTMIALSATLYSQAFVGGSLGFSVSGSSETSGNTTVDGPTSAAFIVSPMAGYYLNSQMAIGVELGLGVTSSNNNRTPTATKTTTTSIAISPFLRYHVVEMGPISLFGQGSIGIGLGSTKIKTGSVSSDGPKTTSFEIAVRPGVSYKLTDQIAIEAFLGGLSYNHTTVKQPNDDKDKDYEFGLSFSTALNLGFVYKF